MCPTAEAGSAGDVRLWHNVVATPSLSIVVNAEGCRVPTFIIRNARQTDLRVDEYEFVHWIAGVANTKAHELCNHVCCYSCLATGHRIVVKTIPWQEDEDEVSTVSLLLNSLQQAIVPARVVHRARKPFRNKALAASATVKVTQDVSSAWFTCVIMPYVGPTLHRVAFDLRPIVKGAYPDGALRAHMRARMVEWLTTVQSIVASVAGCCLDLERAGLCYVDLKKTNVLVACEGDDARSSRRVQLCDYGALTRVNAGDACATYPPPENPTGLGIVASPAVVAYGLGVLFYCLLFPKEEKHFQYVDVRTTPQPEEHGKRIVAYQQFAIHRLRRVENFLSLQPWDEPAPPPPSFNGLSNLMESSFAQAHTVESWLEEFRALDAVYIYSVLSHYLEVRERDSSAYFCIRKHPGF